MKISEQKWTHYVIASTNDPVAAGKIRSHLKKALESFPSGFFEERKSGNAYGFAFSSVRPDASWTVFFGWKEDAGSENPNFAWNRLTVGEDAFMFESDAFWGNPTYLRRDGGVAIASNWIGNVVEIMSALGEKQRFSPAGAYFSVMAHFVPNRVPMLEGIEIFPYGTKAAFPVESAYAGIAFEKTSRPQFRNTGSGMRETVDAYRKSLDEVTEKIVGSSTGKIGILYTGWLDSSALLSHFKKKGHAGRVVAVTVVNPDFPSQDDANAKTIAKDLGIEHRIVELEAKDAFRLPEEIWYAEDPTDVYGYGISLLKAMDANPDVSTFVNGAWTDAAIGSTPVVLWALWNALYAPEKPVKAGIVWKMFSSQVTTDGTNIMELFKSTEFDRNEWARKISRYTLVEPNALGMTKNDFAFGGGWPNVPLEAYGDPYGMDAETLRFHDWLTLLDYDGLAHKFADLYKKSAAAKGVAMFSPLWAQPLRQALFDAPVEYKFNIPCYETGVRDNQLFYKKALWDLIPETIRHRKKRNGSVPDIRLYLTWNTGKPVAKEVFKKFGQRGLILPQSLEKIEKIWDHSESRWNSWHGMSNEEVLYYGNLSFVWRILVLEVFLQLFVDGKGFGAEPASLDLRNFA